MGETIAQSHCRKSRRCKNGGEFFKKTAHNMIKAPFVSDDVFIVC
jgi:hypothetical protein